MWNRSESKQCKNSEDHYMPNIYLEIHRYLLIFLDYWDGSSSNSDYPITFAYCLRLALDIASPLSKAHLFFFFFLLIRVQLCKEASPWTLHPGWTNKQRPSQWRNHHYWQSYVSPLLAVWPFRHCGLIYLLIACLAQWFFCFSRAGMDSFCTHSA